MTAPPPRPSGQFLQAFDPQAQQAALLALSDRFRALTDPADLAFAAAEILATTFGVSRAGYGTIDPAAETITVERDWNAPGIASLAGVLHFRDYGSYIDDLKRGETAVVDDARLDPRTAQTAAALEAISARSFVNMPVTEQGGFVALLYLNHEHARAWSDAELGFIREVADRTRDAVERRRAEDELRRLNTILSQEVKQRTVERDALWEASPDLLSVSSLEGRFLEINPAWQAVLGWTLDELKSHPFADFIHPDDVAATGEAMGTLVDGGSVFDFTNRYRHKDGDYRWLNWNAVPRGDLIYAVVRDVTEATRAAGYAAPHRGSAAPGTEDGGGRPAHRRPRARLQQFARRHLRLARDDPHAARAGPQRRRRALSLGRAERHQARRLAHPPAARLLAPPDAQPHRHRGQPAGRRDGGAGPAFDGAGDRGRDRHRRRIVEHAASMPTSSRTRCSTCASTRATRCPKAAS